MATDPVWPLVQTAFDDHTNQETEQLGPLIRQRKREKNLERVTAAIAGYASTYAAWDDELTPNDDVSVVFSRLFDEVTKRLEERGVDFAAQMQEKRTLL